MRLGALVQEGHQLLDLRLGSLGVDEDAAVLGRCAPSPSLRAEALPQRRVAKCDALHLPLHDCAHRRLASARPVTAGSVRYAFPTLARYSSSFLLFSVSS